MSLQPILSWLAAAPATNIESVQKFIDSMPIDRVTVDGATYVYYAGMYVLSEEPCEVQLRRVPASPQGGTVSRVAKHFAWADGRPVTIGEYPCSDAKMNAGSIIFRTTAGSAVAYLETTGSAIGGIACLRLLRVSVDRGNRVTAYGPGLEKTVTVKNSEGYSSVEYEADGGIGTQTTVRGPTTTVRFNDYSANARGHQRARRETTRLHPHLVRVLYWSCPVGYPNEVQRSYGLTKPDGTVATISDGATSTVGDILSLRHGGFRWDFKIVSDEVCEFAGKFSDA